MEPTIFILIFAFLLAVWYLLWSQSRFVRLINALPGPKTLPILGNALDLINLNQQELNRKMSIEWVKKYGSLYRLSPSIHSMVIIAAPERMEEILRNPKYISKGSAYYPTSPYLSSSLPFATDDQYWRKSRRLLNPAFHIQVLNSYMNVFNEISVAASHEFEKAIEANNGGEFDIFHLMMGCAMDAICETVLGRKKLKKEDKEKLIWHWESLRYIIVQRYIKPWLQFNWLFELTALGHKNKIVMEGIIESSSKFVQCHRDSLKQESTEKEFKTKLNILQDESVNNNNNVSDITDFEKSKKKLGFMDLIVKECDVNGNYSEKEIAQEVATMVKVTQPAWGFETTGLAMIWFLYTIAKHPKHQQMIVDELDAVFGNEDRPCTLQDLTELKHLKYCIKETLRLYPSAPLIMRCLPEDVEIGEYTLPKGVTVGLSIYGMHHNPQVFPDPETFKPERFLPENCIGRHPFAFSPFSAGPRNCIGQKFAMLALQVILANLLRRYHFFVNPSAPEVMTLQDVTLNPNAPVKLVVSKR
uniref:Cytochrome p450 n=1 Tax=Daphnia galeata TaxID=27404 RepID=A0A8J2RDG9_9CRUS|nr:unnamed protein product [Daphnia galeata]